MKKLIIVLIIAICSVAYAAVQITLTVPDSHSVEVLEAFQRLAGKEIRLVVAETPTKTIEIDWKYTYSPKGPNETPKDFIVRAIKENIRAMVRLAKKSKEEERVRNATTVIPIADVNVPDNIIE